MWQTVLKGFWRVAILKESPEITPYSPLLMIIVSFLFFLEIIFQWYLADINKGFSLAISIMAALTLLCTYFVYTYLLLKINSKPNRALQTLTALLASHLIVHLFAFPLLIATPFIVKVDLPPILVLFVGVMYLILTLILTFWQFVVTVYIYKQAIELDNLRAVLAGFGLLACNILTVSFWQ